MRCVWKDTYSSKSSSPLKGFTFKEKKLNIKELFISIFCGFHLEQEGIFSRVSTLLFDLISCLLKPVSITVTDTLNLLRFPSVKQHRWFSVRFLASKPLVLETDLTALVKISGTFFSLIPLSLWKYTEDHEEFSASIWTWYKRSLQPWKVSRVRGTVVSLH